MDNRIAVVMPCYIVDEELVKLTESAIASLGDVHLIIVDNASPMGGGYLRSIADLYVRNKENLGYAKAVNQGLKLTTSRLVAISNNDIRVSPNWQGIVREVFESKKVGSVHLRMTNYEEPFQYGKSINLSGKERWCTGSFFVLKKPASSFQYYDENFFNSYDDWDYFMRLRESGWHTAYTDKACYQHNHSSTQQRIPERETNNLRNKEYFKKKWGEYAEDIFSRKFPEQMKQEYWGGFQI